MFLVFLVVNSRSFSLPAVAGVDSRPNGFGCDSVLLFIKVFAACDDFLQFLFAPQ